MKIKDWIDRAEKIYHRAGGFDFPEAVKLAEEIYRFGAGPCHGGTVGFLSQARMGGKRMDDRKLALCHHYFYRLILILKEQEAAGW